MRFPWFILFLGLVWIFFRGILTKDDINVYAAVLEKPAGTFLNAGKWYDVVASHLAARFVPIRISAYESDLFYSFLFVYVKFWFLFDFVNL